MSQSVKPPDVSLSNGIYCSATICQHVNARDSIVWISTYITYQSENKKSERKERGKDEKRLTVRLEEDSTAVSLCGACLSAKKG